MREVDTIRASKAPFFFSVRPPSKSYSSRVATSTTPCLTTSCGDLESFCQFCGVAHRLGDLHDPKLDLPDLLGDIVHNLRLHFC